MMQATDFEFRNRWWLFGVIFGAGFLLLAFDHVPIGSRIADRLAAAGPLPEVVALHVVFGVAAVIMVAAVLVRAWGSAYLGREVVHDHAVHSEVLRADGPYRHVRNPLYLGNVLMSWAVSLFAPVIGTMALPVMSPPMTSTSALWNAPAFRNLRQHTSDPWMSVAKKMRTGFSVSP